MTRLDLEQLQPHAAIDLAQLGLEHLAAQVLCVGRDALPDHAVYVGRPMPHLKAEHPVRALATCSKGDAATWANPFRLEYEGDLGRGRCLLRYVQHLRTLIEHDAERRAQLFDLRGAPLVCWCSPALCHGHILAELAQQSDEMVSLIGEPASTPAWKLSLDLLESNLTACLRDRTYRLSVSEDNAPTLLHPATGRAYSFARPGQFPLTSILYRREPRKYRLSWAFVCRFVQGQPEQESALYFDGWERGSIRLRREPTPQGNMRKILVNPKETPEDLIAFLTNTYS